MADMSPTEVMALTRDGDGWGCGNGGWMWIIVLFALIFGWGGNGWGNNGFANAIGYENLATSNEVQRGFEVALRFVPLLQRARQQAEQPVGRAQRGGVRAEDDAAPGIGLQQREGRGGDLELGLVDQGADDGARQCGLAGPQVALEQYQVARCELRGEARAARVSVSGRPSPSARTAAAWTPRSPSERY